MRRIAYLCLGLMLLNACAANGRIPHDPLASDGNTLTVFAAASLTGALEEMATAFEGAHPGVVVSLNFAGSNTLRAQIEQGALVDVFASANLLEMNALVENGLVSAGEPHVFLTNSLVIVTPGDNPAGLSVLHDLERPGLKLVMAAEEVPAGRYARMVLENVSPDFKERVMANVVSNETTVKQVLAKVQLGEADAGIVYLSDVVAAPGLHTIEIPAEFNVYAAYPIARLKDCPEPELAEEFVDFVQSADGQQIIQNWGFSPFTVP